MKSSVRLGEIATFRNGLNYSKESFGAGCKVIGVTAFKNRIVPDYDTLEEINPDGVVSIKDYLEAGDVVFVRSNGNKALVGRSLFIEKDESIAISGFCIRARLHDERLLPKYFAYFTKTDFFKRSIGHTASTSINNLSQGVLADVRVPLPSILVQRDIVEVLDAIQGKITLNNKINAELEAMVKLIYDYWFVQFDFPNENGKPYKSSGGKMVWCEQLKREIPERWATSDVAGVTELIKRGISPDYTEEEGLRVINQRCIRNQTINFDTVRTHKGNMSSEDPRIVKRWDVLVNSTGVGTLGRVAHVKVPTNAPYVTDSHVTTLRADASKIARPYFAYSLKRLQPVIEAAANGSTGQVELSRPYLEGIKFVVPDSDLQDMFGDLVSPISEKQALAEAENRELTSLRDWLLPMLMNGQVTVGK